MSELAGRSAKHAVPSPCGTGPDGAQCQEFSTGCTGPLRFLLLRFRGIHNSHYIGINRLRLFCADETEMSFKVLMADDSRDSAAAGAVAGGAGGWWAVSGEEHSLLLQLEDLAPVTRVGMWCANVGATPKELDISDGRVHFPELCAAEEPNEVDISHSQGEPVMLKISPGCGQGDDECQVFDVKLPLEKHMMLRFKGVHDSHYIGINRLRLYAGEKELGYRVVAADDLSSAENVTRKGGWWAVAGADHYLALQLDHSPSDLTSLGLWCANQQATPRELHLVTDMAWIAELTELLEKISETGQRLGPRARKLLESNAELLLGLAHEDERLRWALLVKVWAGEAPDFPIRKSDALGRLQARLFCESCRAQQALPKTRICGLEWRSFKGKMPSLLEVSVQVTSGLLWEAKSHAPEWLGTGLYVPPGGKVSVTTEGKSDGWSVRVGAHTDDISCRDDWRRWPQVSMIHPLSASVTLVTPFGGNVYLVRSDTASKSLCASFSGNLLRQPRVSLADGIDIIEEGEGWVDCEGKEVIFTLPFHALQAAVKNGADVLKALDFWDRLWSCYNELSPHTDPRPQRIVPDVDISVGFMHSGYPIMTHFEGVLDASKDKPIPKVLDLEGLKKTGNWGLFHELGHNMQRESWTFQGTVEVTVNLFTLWGYAQMCEKNDQPHPDYTTQVPSEFLARGAPRAQWDQDPFLALATYAQIIESFGWEALQRTFKSYASEKEVSRDYAAQVRSFVRLWSLELQRDLRPHWRHWGFQEELKLSDPDLDQLKPWSFISRAEKSPYGREIHDKSLINPHKPTINP